MLKSGLLRYIMTLSNRGTAVRDQLLKLLADGCFHSGQELGNQLGVSRTAVWKHMRELELRGVVFQAIRGTGYKLSDEFELLSNSLIEAHLTPFSRDIIRDIEIFSSIDSTNVYARTCAEKDLCGGRLILAEQQTAGRGRRGRQWHSPFGGSIAMSVVWDFHCGASALEGLSLAVGIAVRRALVEQGIADVQLKWPNDVYVRGKKMAGILLEMMGDPSGLCTVVIGLGINYKLGHAVADAIDQPWTDVFSESDEKISRNVLCATVVNHLLFILHQFECDGFAPYQAEWSLADAFCGKKCTLTTARHSTTGYVDGVDARGALILSMPDGQKQFFMGGELSLRLSQ